MYDVREEDIYNEVLIYEVQQRPGLYDKSYKEYSEPSVKAKLWEEVTMIVFSSVWKQLPPEQRLKAGTLVQRRWKNIRTVFTRELRRQQSEKLEPQSKKRRTYRHFDELLFLLPFLQDKELSESYEASMNNEAPSQVRSSTRNVISLAAINGEQVEIQDSIDLEEVYSPVFHSPKTKAKRKTREEYQPDILPETNGTDSGMSDQEKHFALSLVPLLKSLTPHQKLDAQIQILQVFQSFHT